MERPSCLRLAEKCPTKSKKARPGGNLQQGEMLWGSGLVRPLRTSQNFPEIYVIFVGISFQASKVLV